MTSQIIDRAAAGERFALFDHLHGELVSGRIALWTGPVHIDGDLCLDFADDADDDEATDGTIVDGDLELTGNLVNRNGDYGSFLLVTGDLRVGNLVAGGAEIVVLGDLIADGIVFGFYNHGQITVHGGTRATAIITEYHAFDLRGPVRGITVSGRGSITDADTFDSYAAALVPEVLAEGNPPGGYPDWERTAEAILAGRPVLRSHVR